MTANLNTPATVGQLLSIADTMARGSGMLVALALKQVSPDSADRFYDALSRLQDDGTDLAVFIEQALDGVESVRYDLDDSEE